MSAGEGQTNSPSPLSSGTIVKLEESVPSDRQVLTLSAVNSSPTHIDSSTSSSLDGQVANNDKDIDSHDPSTPIGGIKLEFVSGQGEPLELQADLPSNSPAELSDSGGGEDSQEWFQDREHESKRVKVYELIGSRWVDQGTAFCFGQFSQENNEALLIARAETNPQDVILSTAIRSSDVYQRQQDTLIVWTEPDGVDYALSFQDPEGCGEVWNFIQEVQRHMNGGEDQPALPASSPLIGPEPASVTTASIIRSGHLPSPHLGVIAEIDRAIKVLARQQLVKERICEYIQQEDYIKSMIEAMNAAEDLESLENLHALCSLMQTILMLNDHSMYEHILEDDIFFGVVGMLEYDPEFPTHKANYREFLHQTSRFHQPIPIHDETIQRKIHHTYRLQFLKDVVLARVLDDSTFNVLNSCIIFNQIDIITHVQQDPTFLRDVVKLFVDEDMLTGSVQKIPPPKIGNGNANTPKDAKDMKLGEKKTVGEVNVMQVDQKLGDVKTITNGISTSGQRSSWSRAGFFAFAPPDNLSEQEVALRKEVVLLIQQLCVMGKNVQLPARMALFRSLVDRGVLFGAQWALSLPEKERESLVMISTAGEILAALLDHDLNGVRGHVLKQIGAIEKEREAKKRGADKAETLLQLLCRMMAQSRELAVQSQVGDTLKVWMDQPTVPDAPEAHPNVGVKLLGRAKDEPGTERFLEYFYKHCAPTLFKPFEDVPEFKNLTVFPLTREKTNLYLYLCDLLCNFTLQHSFRSHLFLLTTNLSVRVASLLKARDKHLRLAAFRFFRVSLKQNNRNLLNHFMKHDIFQPILDLTLQESRRDNLLSSLCQEFFEHIRRENMKDLIKFCMTQHEPIIRKLSETPLGGPRFQNFIKRWEMNNEPLPPEDKSTKPLDIRQWPGQGRLVEAEEEDYFNGDDEDDDLIPSISTPWMRTGIMSIPGPQSPSLPSNTLKRKRRPAIGSPPKGFRPPHLTHSRTPALGQLVDYDEDDEDDGDAAGYLPVKTRGSPADAPPSSPKLPHRQIHIPAASSSSPASSSSSSAPTSPSSAPISTPPPKRSAPEDDDEDNLLEALVRGKPGPTSNAPSLFAPLSMSMPLGPMRPSEKRRRDDDDDGGLFERLSKTKKVDPGIQKDIVTGGGRTTKLGDDPPKKIKVKFGFGAAAALAGAPMDVTLPASSEASVKDGDTG